MNNRRILLFISINVVIFCSNVSSSPFVRNKLVNNQFEIAWSDNFDDELLDGWEITGINKTEDGTIYFSTGEFSASGGILKATGKNQFNYASRKSTIVYGNWSFDVFVTQSEEDHFYIDFISGDSIDPNIIFNAYGIMIVTHVSFREPGFYLFKYIEGPISSHIFELLDHYYMTVILDQWYYFDITRHKNGDFSVYINDILRLTAKDQNYTTSSYFRFAASSGPALDNISVISSITPTLTTNKSSSESSTSAVVSSSEESKTSIDFIPVSFWMICLSIILQKTRKMKLMKLNY